MNIFSKQIVEELVKISGTRNVKIQMAHRHQIWALKRYNDFNTFVFFKLRMVHQLWKNWVNECFEFINGANGENIWIAYLLILRTFLQEQKVIHFYSSSPIWTLATHWLQFSRIPSIISNLPIHILLFHFGGCLIEKMIHFGKWDVPNIKWETI